MLTPRGRNQGFEHGGGNLSNLFIEHPIARQSLIPTLVQFYIDIEITGSHRRKIFIYTYTCVYMCVCMSVHTYTCVYVCVCVEHAIARQSLIPTLVQFFIDIEITGSHRRKIYTHTYTCVYMCTTAISIIMEGHETAFNGF